MSEDNDEVGYNGKPKGSGRPTYTSMLGAETLGIIAKVMDKKELSFEDVSEDFILRCLLDTLRTSKRPAVQRQILRDIADIKGMLAGKSASGKAQAAKGADDAIGRLNGA